MPANCTAFYRQRIATAFLVLCFVACFETIPDIFIIKSTYNLTSKSVSDPTAYQICLNIEKLLTLIFPKPLIKTNYHTKIVLTYSDNLHRLLCCVL